MSGPFHIAHAAQSGDASELGFIHAVALAAKHGARVTSVHACAAGAPAVDLPHARVLLERWRMDPELVAHDRVQHTCCDSVDDTLLDALRRAAPDLLVAGTHARGGLARVLLGSVAESVARNLRVPTLLLPLDGPPFADAATGALRLDRILLPVGGARDAARALQAAAALARMAGARPRELLVLHTDDGTPWPELATEPGLPVERIAARGSIDDAIARTAEARAPDLVVMVSHGHDSARDVLLSSHTERALHTCRRPLLWVPAGA